MLCWLWLACASPEPAPLGPEPVGCVDEGPSVDADGDGFVASVSSCAHQVVGDCDDGNAAVFPGAPERCNGVDDDCDGWIDGDDPDAALLAFLDADGDGFGDPETLRWGCPEADEVLDGTDCDDTNDAVHPGAEERCDGIADNDCDGVADPAELDGDGDGDGLCTDCDDGDASRSSILEERCNGIDDDCDDLVDELDPSVNPYTCGAACPDEPLEEVAAAAVMVEKRYNPCVLDLATSHLCDEYGNDEPDSGKRMHRTLIRSDVAHYRDQLFLFLPPGPGNSNDTLRAWAVYAGYRTVSLGYPNDGKMEDICAPIGDGCYSDWRYEVTYGVDLSPHIEIAPADSLMRRLEVLLATIAEEDPTLWGRYIDEAGHPVWEDIVVSGWSIGSGHAAFVAKHHPVHGVMLISGPKDRVNDPEPVPSSWLSGPQLTDGCRFTGVYHQGEHFVTPPHDVLYPAWTSLGIALPAYHLEESEGGFGNSQAYTSSIEPPMGCPSHGMVGDDACIPDDFFDAYRDLMCAVAEQRFCEVD